jgi:flagellar basal body rod protein FlgG
LEASAINVANASTPGFKRQISFSQAIDQAKQRDQRPIEVQFLSDFAQGQLNETGKQQDLAIFGPGLFKLRDGDHYVYSRGGSFMRGENGSLKDAAGRVLQQAGSGDLSISADAFELLGDGTILENGLPTSQIGLFEARDDGALSASGGSVFTAPEDAMKDAENSTIRQGFIESSNVAMSDEVVSMMDVTRQAEGGARLVQLYDQLLGQAVSTFSGSSK